MPRALDAWTRVGNPRRSLEIPGGGGFWNDGSRNRYLSDPLNGLSDRTRDSMAVALGTSTRTDKAVARGSR